MVLVLIKVGARSELAGQPWAMAANTSNKGHGRRAAPGALATALANDAHPDQAVLENVEAALSAAGGL